MPKTGCIVSLLSDRQARRCRERRFDCGALDGRKQGRGWTARCPAHDDRDPSLSISISKEGKTLIHCHAGCSQDQVIEALTDLGLWNRGHTPTGIIAPAMIGLVTGVDYKSLAVHRTYLSRDGSGKAGLNPPRMTLGACRGGAAPSVPISRPGARLDQAQIS
jgi:hypothetical protein